jgi:hypothetical protein
MRTSLLSCKALSFAPPLLITPNYQSKVLSSQASEVRVSRVRVREFVCGEINGDLLLVAEWGSKRSFNSWVLS